MIEAVEREELAELLARRRYAKNTRPSVWITGRAAMEVAGVVLAAGYRRRRIITSAEELDALPVGSVVVEAGEGDVYQKLDRCGEINWYEPGDAISWQSLELNLPATVLQIGPAK